MFTEKKYRFSKHCIQNTVSASLTVVKTVGKIIFDAYFRNSEINTGLPNIHEVTELFFILI